MKYTKQDLIDGLKRTIGFHVTNRDSVLMEDLLDGDSLDVTIIGNIYGNPDLLEDNK